MGETRHPSRGTWHVYEGEGPPVASTEDTIDAVNRELEWPLAFTVGRIVDRVWTRVTVEVAEDFTVTHKLEQLNLEAPLTDGGGEPTVAAPAHASLIDDAEVRR